MSWLESIGLGVLQGATEFLPISSSGHLRLAENLFGSGEPDLFFDIVLHVGTLLAVMVVYRRDLVDIVRGALAGLKALLGGEGLRGALEPQGARLLILMVVATLPTGVIGLFLNDLVDSPFFSLPVVGGLLLVNGCILLSSRATKMGRASVASAADDEDELDTNEDGKALSLWNIGLVAAIVIGIAQGLAVLPGISRSGLTITTALFLSVRREEAARYSFLLSIPAILGALVLKVPDALETPMASERLLEFGIGALASFVVGWGCLLLLMRMLRNAQFHHFAWYCFALGTFAITWHFVG